MVLTPAMESDALSDSTGTVHGLQTYMLTNHPYTGNRNENFKIKKSIMEDGNDVLAIGSSMSN